MSFIAFPLPLQIVFALTKIDGVENLRFIDRCWYKREKGEPLDFDANEGEAAEWFEQWLREGLLSENPRAALFQLDKALNPSYSVKLTLREAALRAWLDLYKSSPTWKQIKQRVKTFYKIDRDDITWRALRRTRPFCDYF